MITLYKPTHRANVSVDRPTTAGLMWNPEWTGIGGVHVPARHTIWEQGAANRAANRAAARECDLVETDGVATNWAFWCLTHDGGADTPVSACFDHPQWI